MREMEGPILLGSRELFYFGEVATEDIETIAIGLRKLRWASSSKPVTIHLSSLGGDAYDAMALYDMISAMPCEVTICGWGIVASAGTLILQAADHRLLGPKCTVMIHDGTYEVEGPRGVVAPWAEYELGKNADMLNRIWLDKMKESDPNLTMSKLKKMCTSDRIYTADEAVAAGLADEVITTF